MTLANPSLTSTGRLENLSDRVTNLRDRLDGLRDREHLSEWLRDDLDAVRTLLDRIDRAVAEALGRIHSLTRFGDEICPEAKQLANTLVLAEDPWINYAHARLAAANIAYLALRHAPLSAPHRHPAAHSPPVRGPAPSPVADEDSPAAPGTGPDGGPRHRASAAFQAAHGRPPAAENAAAAPAGQGTVSG